MVTGLTRVTALLLFWTFSSHGNVTRELLLDVVENIPEGTLIGTITGPAPPYLIVGTDTSDLVIDQSNGEIRTKVKLDREVRDLYSFVAIPLNGEGVRVSVRVSDENDNGPTFATPVMNVEIPENTPRDVKRTLQPARDRDLGLFNTQRYVISAGNVNNAFRLASHRERDGVLYLDLQVNGFLDRETTPYYNLVIDAYDGGIPPLKGSMTVHIALTDLNDNSPIFNQSRYFATISENVTTGTTVLQVFATDTDDGVNGQVTYSINRRQTDKDSYFTVDPTSGVISVNRPLDYETKEVHELVVVARDNGREPLETTVFVSIRILDVNDHQPLISLVFLTSHGGPHLTEGAAPGEFVARVTLSDPDNKVDYTRVTVKLVSGGRGHFQLEKRNEAIYLMVGSRAVIDREKIPEYVLILMATDPTIPSLNATVTVRLTVTDLNDNSPVFRENEFHGIVDQAAEVGRSVIQVSALDPDEGLNSEVRYSLGSSSDWFRIDALTGVISTRAQVDCEVNPMSKITVVATDRGVPSLSSTATVFIQVRSVNLNEPIFEKSFYNVSVPEDAPVGKCILKVFATDPDCGLSGVVTYSIKEMTGQSLPWILNASTGELCVSGSLDYETRKVYDLRLMATDSGGLSSTAVARIELLNVNDNDPTFYPSLYEATVFADTPTHVVTVKATDADLKSTLTYKILRGNDASAFDIHADLGVITLKQTLPKGLFELMVSATDEDGRASEPARVIVNVAGGSKGRITVPQFGKIRYAFRVSEDAPVHSTIGTVSAKPSGGGTKVIYTISSGDPGPYFMIDGTTGQIKTLKSLNYEVASRVFLQVTAKDESGPGISHAQVEIEIQNVNDNRPEFESSSIALWVAESAKIGSIIYRVRATDTDSEEFGRVTYRLLGDTSDHFRLNPDTGDLSLLQALDYEKVKKFEMVVSAVDFGNPPNSASCTILINVQDSNDNSPRFNREGYHLRLLETLPVNSQVMEVRAEDDDTGNNGRITYNLSATNTEDQGLFDIAATTGLLTLKAPLDRESRQSHVVTIVAKDHGIPSLSTTTTLTVTVTDENDNAPTFEQPLYNFSVDENSSSGTYVGRVIAKDIDSGDNGVVRYFVQEEGLESGFEIDGISGIIRTTIMNLDREKRPRYELQVVAHDLGHPQRQAEVIVQVKVNDFNDFSPRVVEPEDERILVREEQPEGTEVTKVVAIDSDEGENGTVVYALGNDEDFSIDPVSGVVRTRRPLRYDLQSIFNLQVVVRDKGFPPLETVQEYRVEVLELDDTFHQIQTGSKITLEVSESASIGHFVGSVRREDEAETRLTFGLIRANSSDGTFELDKRTGKIYLARTLDFEVTSEYSLQVKVNEPGGTSTLRQITILVLDENDERPTFTVTSDPVYFHVPEDTPIGTGVWNSTAEDLDSGVNGVVHYSLTLQKPSNKFRINALTGRIYLEESLDYEKESAYVLVVMATDQALDMDRRLSSAVTLWVVIDDVNDNVARFVSPSRVSVSNTVSAGSWILTVQAVDDDDGVNGKVTYDLVDRGDSSWFKLDSKNGHLTVGNKVLERSLYIFNVSATDGGSPPSKAFQTVQVNVEMQDQTPPRFEKSRYTTKVTENAIKGTTVVKLGTMSKGPNNTVLYVLPEASAEGQFGLHPHTGTLTVTSPLDREISTDHNLTVYLFDTQMNVRYDTATVMVKVEDQNDNLPKIICPNLILPENQELGVIHTFAATDADSGRKGEVTFVITQGNSDNTFSLDLHGGQLKSRPLDRERRGQYLLVVTAQDQGLPIQRASCNMTVTVKDENDNSPDFIQKEYRTTVSEDMRVGSTVLKVEATDADIGNNAAIFYSLNNVTSAHFRIEEKTGAIVLVRSLDREKLREYSFEVVATDGGIYDSRSSKARVTVTLTDINDNRPRFATSPVMVLEIPADTKPGTRIGEVKAVDSDSSINGHVTYTLNSSTTKFRVHPDSGVLTIGQSLENEAGKVINLQIIAKDQGVPALTTTAMVQILFGRVPIAATMRFTETTYEKTISENSEQGTNILRVTALRNDGRHQKIRYEIIIGNEDGGFEIDTSTGQITVRNSTVLDRELCQNFTLIIFAQTEGGQPFLTAFSVVIIKLDDENDSNPEFHQDFYSMAVWEGNSKGAFVIQVSAQDDDIGANSNLMYYIIDGNEDNAFVIDPPHSGIVKTNIVLDREIQEEYRLTLMATDDGTPQLSSSCILKIRVMDLNDNLPTFPPVSDVNVKEATPVGTLLTTIMANDIDAHPDLVYALESRSTSEYFSLGKYDGRIWLMKELDYEKQKRHVVRIRVSDSVHDAVTELKINVIDSNDHAPKFDKDVYVGIISDQTEPGTEIMQVTATDADTPASNGPGLKYSLHVPNSPKSRVIGNKLRIDEFSGKIFTNDTFAQLGIQPGYVEMTVICKDLGNPPMQSKVTLWIQIRTGKSDVIKFSAEKYTAEIPQVQSLGEVLLKLDATQDRYQNQDTNIHYNFAAGNSEDFFTIGSQTGEIRLVKRIPLNSPSEFVLTVALTCSEILHCDNTTTTVLLTKSPSLYIPKFNQSLYTVVVSERKPIGSTIFKFEPSNVPTSKPPISYTITSGRHGSRPFELHALAGTVTLKEFLHYEQAKEYRVVVLAQTEEGSRTLVTLQIVVEDSNDHAPRFLLANYLEFVAENEPVGSPVFVSRAIDPDGTLYGNVTYSILETSANQKFMIDATTGVVTTATIFDYESLNRFHFTLRAVDSGGLSATVKVQVDVSSRDEYAPIFRQKVYRWTVPSNAEVGHTIGTVRATDEDQGIDGVVLYTIISQPMLQNLFKVNRTTGGVTIRELLPADLNTTLVISASSGQLDSKSASVTLQVSVGPPSQFLGTIRNPGMSEWLIGAVVTAAVLVLLTVGIVLIFYVKRHNRRKSKNRPSPKNDLNYGGNFDTLAYTAHSTMLAGGNSSQQNSIYSPQYSDLAELSRRSRNPAASDLSEKSQNSASSGRGSAEEEDDEEIRMINEGRLQEQKLRESMGLLPDSGMLEGDEDSIKNTQEYLARLGIRPMLENNTETEMPFDLSLIYSQIPGDEGDGAQGHAEGKGQAHLGENWDYLQHWGPQYQPLAHVFSEIARLNEDVASGHYSGVVGQNDKGKIQVPSGNSSMSGKSDTSKGQGQPAHAQSSRSVKTGPPLSGPLPILPRSPITADLSYSTPLSPSFSPELSFCNALPVLPEHNVGIRTTVYPHPSYASSESSEIRM